MIILASLALVICMSEIKYSVRECIRLAEFNLLRGNILTAISLLEDAIYLMKGGYIEDGKIDN